MRRLCAIAALIVAAGCSAHAPATSEQTQAPTASPETAAPLARDDEGESSRADLSHSATPATDPAGAASPDAVASAPVSADVAVATPVPTAAPTANPNLLAYAHGAYIRTWSRGAAKRATALAAGSPWEIVPAFKGAPYVVFELPATATIDRVDIGATSSALPATLHVDISTTGPAQFRRAGEIALRAAAPGGAHPLTGSLNGPLSARWIRLSVDRPPGATFSIDSAIATGSVHAQRLSYAGNWSYAFDPYGANDVVFSGTTGAVDGAGTPGPAIWQGSTIENASSFDGGACNFVRPFWHGSVVDGSGELGSGNRVTVVAGGNLLIGSVDGESIVARRIPNADKCHPPASGSGPEMLVIKHTPSDEGNESNGSRLPGHRFVTAFLPEFRAADLQHAQAVMLAYDCNADTDFTAAQTKALLDYVTVGHVLTIRDSDICGHSHYSFLPFPFATSNAGGSGQHGGELAIVDSSVLASSDPTDHGHFIDAKAYLANTMQQIGDTSIMDTGDVHWCGLLYARNSKGKSGWVQAYAHLGRGIVLFNGFDVDDLDNHIAQAERIAQLDYGLSPQTDLPCSAKVASPLMIWSSVQLRRPAGTAKDLVIPFRVAHQGGLPNRHIRMSLAPAPASGWAARIDRPAFDLGNEPQTVNVHLHVPANAPAVPSLYTLTATDAGGTSAQASIAIQSDQALAASLERGGRARIYGIHFDVASARIQPRSEQTIREIAGVLASHPAWRMRIEGHTDSDGTAPYNQDLSVRRAKAVVARLTSAHHIAGTRLSAAGYGETRPVASNATEAGKALNRRVELVRL